MFLLLACGVATASGVGEADLTVAEEKALLQNVFSPQLETIDADPARVLGDIAIERIDSPTEALVTMEGHTVLLESEIPLRAPEEDGDLSKVDLALEEDAGGGYAPANPLVDLALPESADDPIAIGEDGLTLSLQGAAETTASPLGEEDLFLPEAREDTSLLLSPISGGLELSAMLLSPDSPERLTFAVDLPDGQKLRASEEGGAEVVNADDEVEARVSVPRAFDAEGEEVPVELAVEGNSLVLSVPHREEDVAYPLFVDPEIIEENWSGFSDTSKLNYWFWQYGGSGGENYLGSRSCITTCWANGLYLRARLGYTYSAGAYGRWGFVPQGTTTYMRRVIFGPIHMDPHGCYGSEPHGYVGVWNTGNFWSVLTNAYPTGYVTYLDTGEGQNLGAGARTAYVAMHAGSTTTMTCGRDYQLGGATLFLDDPEDATVGAPTGYPSGWVKDGTSFTVNVPVSDPGLGVKSATISPAEAPPLSSKSLTCTAHYNDQCPASHTFQFNVSADSFDQGEKEVRASAEDAIKRGSNTASWMMKVDRTPPEITLDGQLAEATDETGTDSQDPEKWDALKLPVYNLKIDATDGSTASAAAKRSGVKGIAVYLDDRKAPEQVWWAPSCPESSCPLSKTFTLKLNELSADTHHTLRIFAQDFAENAPRERTIEFEYIPATGIKESDVMQYFPLPDGQGNEDEEEHPSRPELAVNVVNGNLVYRQTDAEVQGVGADLGLDLYYNSLLPESQNSEWGDGWTLSQTPDLELEEPEGSGPVSEATLVEESGGVESKVDLPATVGEEEFDKRLQATITKEAGGDFGLTDESGETDETLVFDESGQVTEARTGSAATVDYDYEGGELSELSIEDPGTAMVAPGSLEEDEVPHPAIAHAGDFGSTGSANGEMDVPADVVVDSQENLWVLDRGNSRIQKFAANGQFLFRFGSAGTGEGQLNSPSALALDAAGNLWVAENHRVQKFSPEGTSLLKFGSLGGGQGQFYAPTGIAVGIDGSIWVADATRVQRFSASGQFIEQVGASGEGQIYAPQSLSADPQGNVYVADASDDKVKVFDKEGDYLRSFGSSGTGPGQFSEPTEVEADADGYVWVGDDEADRVQLFTAAGDYVDQFGAPGTGEGKLNLEQWAGIASDGKGRLWIADAGNDRAQQWLVKSITDFYPGTDLGGSGSGDGELDLPADAALDPEGNLWVLDRGNSRVQKFGPDGQFLAKFGSPGTGEGQLNNPSALTLDGAGNILVAENNRVQKFSPSGTSLAKFGSFGGGQGQFTFPTGIAVGADGSIWVADASRVQRFSASGQFIERVGAEGPGQILAPQSLSSDAEGNVFVADSQDDKVKVFDKEGDYLRQFGSSGSGPGQLSNPTEVAADAEGNVWVGDDELDRVELFTAAGDYVAQFDSAGPGEEELELEQWAGIASDGTGRLWIADTANDRVGSVLGGHYVASNEPALTEDDPKLEVEVSEGLVQSVEGEEAGTIDYEHSGDLLTAVTKPEGEVEFAYDEAGRMTKVTLPNGTYGEIAYADSYGRVKSVKVSVEGGAPKTTYFEYTDEPRRTTVTPPDAPATTYDIGPNGSILKWANAKKPPLFDDIAGSLYDENNRETKEPISAGAHNLVIQAHSDEGIASIQVIANSNSLVDEKTCAQDPEKEGIECVTQEDEWVTETGNWAPGILYLEVIATDRLGESTSERFWVNIPYTPPPDPEAEEPPRFNDIAKFREEHGLDLDLKGDEIAINDRIFQLMGDWNNPNTPAGEVARATRGRWGAPLRSVDAAELEYRQAYWSQAESAISAWAKQNASTSFAGYYLDEAAGGLIRVGFTGNQASQVDALKQGAGLMASARITGFSSVPQHSLASLESLEAEVISAASTYSPGLISTISTDFVEGIVEVGATNVAEATAKLQAAFGNGLPISVVFREPLEPLAGRNRITGRMLAGDRILLRESDGNEASCTAGFGAFESGSNPSTGAIVPRHFLLTAAHCAVPESGVRRQTRPYFGVDPSEKQRIGTVKRYGFDALFGKTYLDAEAIRYEEHEGITPRQIYPEEGLPPIDVKGMGIVRRGTRVCASGASSGEEEPRPRRIKCGEVISSRPALIYVKVDKYFEPPVYEWCYNRGARDGDSGGPVWIEGTNTAVGIISVSGGGTACFQPIAPDAGHPEALAVFGDSRIGPLRLSTQP